MQAHAGMVFATARRVTRDAALADDVTQETFLELARNAAVVRDSVGAWLHRVARHRACNMVRAAGTRRRYEEAATAAEIEPDRAEATWAEIEPLIDEALDGLQENVRVAVVEHFLEGRTQQEIAARLGVSQPTVSRTLEAGIAELRARLRRSEVVAGAGLGLALAAHATVVPSAELMASLGKLAVSGVGAGVAAKTAGGAMAWITAWWRPVLLAVVGIAAGVAAYILFPVTGARMAVVSAEAVPPRSESVRPAPAGQKSPGQPGEQDWLGRAFCPMCAMEHTAGRQPEHGIFIHAEDGKDVVYDLKLPRAVTDFHARYCGPSMGDKVAVHVKGTVETRDGRRTLALGTLERAAR